MTDLGYDGPPITFSDYEREGFEWCQVIYLYARELVQAGVDERLALEEAFMVREAMELWGSPTPVLGAPGHERYELLVHWPTLVCAANAYASLPPNRRLEIREMIKAGTPASELPAGYGAGGCDRSVLDDEEYIPRPPCLPKQVVSTTFAAIGAFTLSALLAWLIMRR